MTLVLDHDVAGVVTPTTVTSSARATVPARAPLRPASGRWLSVTLIAAGDTTVLTAAVLVARPSAAEAAIYAIGLGLVLLAAGTYRPRTNLQAVVEAPWHIALAAMAVVVLAPIGIVEGISTTAITLACLTAVLLPLGRSLTYGAIRALRRHRVVRDRVVVIGAGQVGAALGRALEDRTDHGMQLVGFVDDIDPAGAPAPLLGELEALDNVLEKQGVRRIIVAFGTRRDGDLVRVLRAAVRRRIDVYVVPRFHEVGIQDAGWGWKSESVACTPLQRVRPAAPRSYSWRAKRAFDVAVSVTALILLAPLMALLALLVKMSGPGPVLFRQDRVGQHGRIFQLLKFRSLPVNDDSDVRWSADGDGQTTHLGAWMRRLSLDELPQLWNVARGDMSLVGPRPERPHFVRQFTGQVDGYGDRHRLPVGLTGWAQIHGLRGDTSIDERAKFDNYYIEHWSLVRDVSILISTVAAVARDARKRHRA